MLPEGFKKEILGIPGIDGDALFHALQGEAQVSVRLNPRKGDAGSLREALPADGIVEWCAGQGFYLRERPKFTMMPELHQGLFYVQEASSMVHTAIMEEIAKREEGRKLRVLDMCAAPGGKTTAMIDTVAEGSLVVANEYSGPRANILAENLRKWGYPHIIVTTGDTAKFRKLKERFDVVAVDAPCSGEGMMRKEEMARQQWSEGLVRQCSALQRDILSNAVAALDDGGYLIYSTCTFNLEENEKQVEWLKEEYGLEDISLGFIEGNEKGISLAEGVEGKRFMPHITRGEGLFAALLKKGGKSNAKFPKREKGAGRSQGAEEKYGKELKKYGNFDGFGIYQKENLIYALQPEYARIHDEIGKNLRVLVHGLEIGEMKGKGLIPTQQLAMWTGLDYQGPEKEVTLQEALSYLSRNNLPGYPDTENGMMLLRYKGMPLGWVKNLGNRCNNLYPQEWRIRNFVSWE